MASSGRGRFGPAQAARFYDRIGSAQDTQAFYEDAAVDRLLAEARLGDAGRVLEIGCGTGRLAERLLTDWLPPEATYLGIDVSPTMVRLSRARVAPWRDRARVVQVKGGEQPLPPDSGSIDRVVTTYVLDLLGDDDRPATIRECQRVLRTGGLLCHAGLAPGQGPFTSAVSAIWRGVHAISPWLVGGCAPFLLAEELPAADWRVRHVARVARFGITSEVVVAEAI